MQEPALSFCHAGLKLKWAGILLDNLKSSVNALIKSETHSVSLGYDLEDDSIQVNVTPARMPLELPCLIGDICHNYRNVFDYCWMGLSRSVGHKKKLTMPMGGNRDGLISSVGKSLVGQSFPKAKGLLGDTICSHYDFQNGGNRALAELNELSNWQKHNLLVPTLGATWIEELYLETTSIGSCVIKDQRVYGNKMTAGIELGGRPLKFENRGKTTYDVFFEGPEFVTLQAVLPAMVKFHKAAIEGLYAFCEAFPSDDNPKFV